MPPAAEIVHGLSEIANRALPIAIAWHVAFAAAIAGWALGLRPSRRTAALLCCLPLVSVAALAWAFGNPFNGAVFTALAALLGGIAVRLPRERVRAGPRWAQATGFAMLAFGWLYPHFVAGPAWRYLYAAPLGLLPCPTLSAVIGATLVASGFGSRASSYALSAAGLFYALFGAARLGVWLDLGLLLGALSLLGLATVQNTKNRSSSGISVRSGSTKLTSGTLKLP